MQNELWHGLIQFLFAFILLFVWFIPGPYNYDVLEGMTFGNISESFNADFEDGTIGEVIIFPFVM